MLRDEQIEKITSRLDKMIKEEDKKIQYEAIMTLANHNMNLDLFVDEKGNHQLFWNNKKCSTTHSGDVEKLLQYIEKVDI